MLKNIFKILLSLTLFANLFLNQNIFAMEDEDKSMQIEQPVDGIAPLGVTRSSSNSIGGAPSAASATPKTGPLKTKRTRDDQKISPKTPEGQRIGQNTGLTPLVGAASLGASAQEQKEKQKQGTHKRARTEVGSSWDEEDEEEAMPGIESACPAAAAAAAAADSQTGQPGSLISPLRPPVICTAQFTPIKPPVESVQILPYVFLKNMDLIGFFDGEKSEKIESFVNRCVNKNRAMRFSQIEQVRVTLDDIFEGTQYQKTKELLLSKFLHEDGQLLIEKGSLKCIRIISMDRPSIDEPFQDLLYFSCKLNSLSRCDFEDIRDFFKLKLNENNFKILDFIFKHLNPEIAKELINYYLGKICDLHIPDLDFFIYTIESHFDKAFLEIISRHILTEQKAKILVINLSHILTPSLEGGVIKGGHFGQQIDKVFEQDHSRISFLDKIASLRNIRLGIWRAKRDGCPDINKFTSLFPSDWNKNKIIECILKVFTDYRSGQVFSHSQVIAAAAASSSSSSSSCAPALEALSTTEIIHSLRDIDLVVSFHSNFENMYGFNTINTAFPIIKLDFDLSQDPQILANSICLDDKIEFFKNWLCIYCTLINKQDITDTNFGLGLSISEYRNDISGEIKKTVTVAGIVFDLKNSEGKTVQQVKEILGIFIKTLRDKIVYIERSMENRFIMQERVPVENMQCAAAAAASSSSSASSSGSCVPAGPRSILEAAALARSTPGFTASSGTARSLFPPVAPECVVPPAGLPVYSGSPLAQPPALPALEEEAPAGIPPLHGTDQSWASQ